MPTGGDGGQKVKVGEAFTPRRLDAPLDRLTRRRGGRRTRTRTDRKRGRYIQARPARGKSDDIAFDATLRAAAPFQQRRIKQREQVAFAIETADLQRKVRVKRTANLVLFVVDASWSMAVAERMSATKGAILSLLTDAYQRRDRVGLIVFQKDRATLVLPPQIPSNSPSGHWWIFPLVEKHPLGWLIPGSPGYFAREEHPPRRDPFNYPAD
jgi:magnesium chelatase subunit ChlD-like protein